MASSVAEPQLAARTHSDDKIAMDAIWLVWWIKASEPFPWRSKVS